MRVIFFNATDRHIQKIPSHSQAHSECIRIYNLLIFHDFPFLPRFRPLNVINFALKHFFLNFLALASLLNARDREKGLNLFRINYSLL